MNVVHSGDVLYFLASQVTVTGSSVAHINDEKKHVKNHPKKYPKPSYYHYINIICNIIAIYILYISVVSPSKKKSKHLQIHCFLWHFQGHVGMWILQTFPRPPSDTAEAPESPVGWAGYCGNVNGMVVPLPRNCKGTLWTVNDYSD